MAFLFYIPVMAALTYQLLVCVLLLARGQLVGGYGLLYAAALYILGSRASRIRLGQVEAGSLWKDIAGMAVANALLAVIALSVFA